jgi:hypothetical protein
MINAEGQRICDKEIWSRSRKLWCGCRRPASVDAPSRYIPSGLDYCPRHAPKPIHISPVRFRTIQSNGLILTLKSGNLWYWRAFANGERIAKSYAGWSSEAAAYKAGKATFNNEPGTEKYRINVIRS